MAKCLTGDAQKDTYLPLTPWFDVAEFPKAIFDAHNFKHIKDSSYMAEGAMTLKGVTMPLSLPFTLT